MTNFALAAFLNFLDTLQAIFDLSWSRLQKYIMKSVLTTIAYGMTNQTPLTKDNVKHNLENQKLGVSRTCYGLNAIKYTK
jgi:hypothetical protein